MHSSAALPFYDFALGPFQLRVWHDHSAIYQSRLLATPVTDTGAHAHAGALNMRIGAQLRDYLQHPTRPFELPLRPQGTAFQQRVWSLLQSIPAGQTRTYGQAANILDSAAQPVGGACKANPLPFFIPCHRIVAKQGIGGYAGQWAEGEQVNIKAWLLAHERQGGDDSTG